MNEKQTRQTIFNWILLWLFLALGLYLSGVRPVGAQAATAAQHKLLRQSLYRLLPTRPVNHRIIRFVYTYAMMTARPLPPNPSPWNGCPRSYPCPASPTRTAVAPGRWDGVSTRFSWTGRWTRFQPSPWPKGAYAALA
jgi:hypothetical protein